MGRQVVFYMVDGDLEEFEARLKARDPDLLILVDPMPGPDLRTSDTLGRIPGDFGMRSLARREDLPLLRSTHVPTRGYYLIDRTFSPVVEFSRCFPDERADRLRPGRLYFTTSYWDESGNLVTFPKDFLAWGDRLLALIRKGRGFRHVDGDYLSDRTRAWMAGGGKLWGQP